MAIFRNKLSVPAYEQKHNATLSVRPHKSKVGIFLFCHSDDPNAPAEGLVSKQAVEHLKAHPEDGWDQLQVATCDYMDDNQQPQSCLMLMMGQVNNASSTVLFSRAKKAE